MDCWSYIAVVIKIYSLWKIILTIRQPSLPEIFASHSSDGSGFRRKSQNQKPETRRERRIKNLRERRNSLKMILLVWHLRLRQDSSIRPGNPLRIPPFPSDFRPPFPPCFRFFGFDLSAGRPTKSLRPEACYPYYVSCVSRLAGKFRRSSCEEP